MTIETEEPRYHDCTLGLDCCACGAMALGHYPGPDGVVHQAHRGCAGKLPTAPARSIVPDDPPQPEESPASPDPAPAAEPDVEDGELPPY